MAIILDCSEGEEIRSAVAVFVVTNGDANRAPPAKRSEPTAARTIVDASGTGLTVNKSPADEKGEPVYVYEVPTGMVG